MAVLSKDKQLKKELTLFNIYTIATGSTIASGFFLLPGIAAAEAGAMLPLSYMVAALLLVPGLVSKTELATAMPRAGGIYYYLDRSMGPLLGTVGGFGTWIALSLKAAFALIGIGAYLALFLPDVPMQPIAAGFVILFGVVNLLGAKKTGSAQVFLVVGLILLLFWVTGIGLFQMKASHFSGFFDNDFDSLLSTTGLVIVSYMGLTKVASIAEEVKNPERNLPRGIFLAFVSAILIYLIGTSMMVGVMSVETLSGDLTPVASVAEILVGEWGAVLMTIAAILAFSSVANAGILSASRYPLAMSRDHLLPGIFSKLSDRKTPTYAVFLTAGLILIFVTAFDPTKIAKLASAFKLFMFALSCLAVIVMRESQIESYDPGYRAPFYPWMQIIGIILPIVFIGQMGWLPILFTLGLTIIGIFWYFYYARSRVVRDGAIYHIFARLGERRFEGLDRELRGILREKGLRKQDPFDAVVASASIIDLDRKTSFETIVEDAAGQLEKHFPGQKKNLIEGFMRGTKIGATPVSGGVALPHMRMIGIAHPELVMVRAQKGVHIEIENELSHESQNKGPIYAVFFLVSPEEDPGQHLRILAQIANHVDIKFMQRWKDAENEQELKEILLRDDHFISLVLRNNTKTAPFINKKIRDLTLPEGSLITLIHRNGSIIVPQGRTMLHADDQLTIIGYPDGIKRIYDEYEI